MGDIIEAATVDELESGQAKLIEIEGNEIALINSGGEYYAIDNECSHIGGPLCEGEIDGSTVTCPWHGAQFDLKSGTPLSPPAEGSLMTYKVYVDGDSIKIEV